MTTTTTATTVPSYVEDEIHDTLVAIGACVDRPHDACPLRLMEAGEELTNEEVRYHGHLELYDEGAVNSAWSSDGSVRTGPSEEYRQYHCQPIRIVGATWALKRLRRAHTNGHVSRHVGSLAIWPGVDIDEVRTLLTEFRWGVDASLLDALDDPEVAREWVRARHEIASSDDGRSILVDGEPFKIESSRLRRPPALEELRRRHGALWTAELADEPVPPHGPDDGRPARGIPGAVVELSDPERVGQPISVAIYAVRSAWPGPCVCHPDRVVVFQGVAISDGGWNYRGSTIMGFVADGTAYALPSREDFED